MLRVCCAAPGFGSAEGDDAPSSRSSYLSAAASGRGGRHGAAAGAAGEASAADVVLAVINSTRQRASKLSNRFRQVRALPCPSLFTAVKGTVQLPQHVHTVDLCCAWYWIPQQLQEMRPPPLVSHPITLSCCVCLLLFLSCYASCRLDMSRAARARLTPRGWMPHLTQPTPVTAAAAAHSRRQHRSGLPVVSPGFDQVSCTAASYPQHVTEAWHPVAAGVSILQRLGLPTMLCGLCWHICVVATRG